MAKQRPSRCPKGNLEKFIDRQGNMCAVGAPTGGPLETVSNCLQQYSLQDEADALIHDTIHPQPTRIPTHDSSGPYKIPDKRNAGWFTDVGSIVNPPVKTKFQDLVDEMKETFYKSSWEQRLGMLPDRVSMLPNGFDLKGTTFGKKCQQDYSAYDTFLPPIPVPNQTPKSKLLTARPNRNYVQPPYDPEGIYGHKTNQDKSGKRMKCCLTDDNIAVGRALATPIDEMQVNFKYKRQSCLGEPLTPNKNIELLPEGYTFGMIERPVTTNNIYTFSSISPCPITEDKIVYMKALAHINTVRKCLSKRYTANFFRKFALDFIYLDKCKTGWLPKQVIYDNCIPKNIYIEQREIEHLLTLLDAFDGSQIKYETFIGLLDYTRNSCEFPKVSDMSAECLDYRTTYGEMVKPDQEINSKEPRAGLPSGRYLDRDYPIVPERYCKADIVCLPQETDASICLRPSILSILGVSHRDVYAVRGPQTVRRVFEASGEKFTNNDFERVWNQATKYHCKGLVCYETFRKALDDIKSGNKDE